MSDLPLPELPETPPPNGRSLLVRVQPLLTLVIAVVAITLAVWEGLENRRHNRLSVQPRLSGGVELGRVDTQEYVRLAVENTGLGPAVVRAVRVLLDGALVEAGETATNNPWTPVIAAVSRDGMSINAHAFGDGYYFPAGRNHVLFEARQPDGVSTESGSFRTILDRIAVQICYCSIYGTDCDQIVITTNDASFEPCPR